MKKLREIFDHHKCDKGSLRHRYDRVYEPALEYLRNKEFNMLEIGIFKGNSLASWIDFFPHATIMGIDIFTRIPVKKIPILSHSRVSWCECDSIKGPNEEFINAVNDYKFDVIIDDGLHTHDSQRETFENFIPYLKNDGVYFIEDVWAFDRMTKIQKQHSWIIKHATKYSDNQYDALLTILESYKVKFHDLRADTEPDTFIIEIRK